ncbi:hypothetical protein EGN72_00300 [Pseudorhodobacter sp. E13]|uniref:hypothetical protein n=1 Tax=Pseudorhodobacter sp. E13 TaxID=2487931 RepID=UPI000F8D6DD7|nr:hypothetical protein [Pseudorhodobacter sp. E13]RUS65314.1 hypothetical protein EGN72_00300 [Pseudorhodobacter sp. E13]
MNYNVEIRTQTEGEDVGASPKAVLSKADGPSIMLGQVLIASLGGYGASILAFFLFSPVSWVVVVLAFLPGAIVAVAAVVVLRRFLRGRR